MPTGWESKQIESDRTIPRTTKAEVKKWEFDPKFLADAFAPNPPRSSHVTVYSDGEKKEEYLIRPDGSKRQTKSSERNKAYDELIQTNADGTLYVPSRK